MKRVLMSIMFLSILTGSLRAQDATSIRKQDFNLEKNVAIHGYDPVAYFKENKAVNTPGVYIVKLSEGFRILLGV